MNNYDTIGDLLQTANLQTLIGYCKGTTTNEKLKQEIEELRSLPNSLAIYSNIRYRYCSSQMSFIFENIKTMDERLRAIGRVISFTYQDKWEKLTDLYNEEYNPLAPFSIKLEETNSAKYNVLVDKRNDTYTYGKTITSNGNTMNTIGSSEDRTRQDTKEITGNHSDTTTENTSNVKSGSIDTNNNEVAMSTVRVTEDKGNDISNDSLYGFNSATPVPTSSTENEYSRTSNTENPTTIDRSSKEKYNNVTEQKTGNTNVSKDFTDTETVNSSDSTTTSATNNSTDSNTTKNSGTDSYIFNRQYGTENTGSREYTRQGNIGNTSFQELFEKERAKLEHLLLNTITDDIISVLCRNTYKID